MNYLQSYIPIVKKIKGENQDEWVFCIKNLNNLESKSIDEGDYDKYEPFVLDDISLDFSKIPVITISNGKLKYVNIQGKDFIGDAISCPYKPIEKPEEETEKKEKTEEEEEEDKNDVNKSKDDDISKDSNDDNNNNDDDDDDENGGKRKSTTSSDKGKKTLKKRPLKRRIIKKKKS